MEGLVTNLNLEVEMERSKVKQATEMMLAYKKLAHDALGVDKTDVQEQMHDLGKDTHQVSCSVGQHIGSSTFTHRVRK